MKNKLIFIFIYIFNLCNDIFSQKLNLEDIIKIYPNPVRDILFVDLNSFDSQKVNISIYNILGKIVYEVKESVVNNNLVYEIVLSEQTQGIYFLKMLIDNQIIIKKILIMK